MQEGQGTGVTEGGKVGEDGGIRGVWRSRLQPQHRMHLGEHQKVKLEG